MLATHLKEFHSSRIILLIIFVNRCEHSNPYQETSANLITV